MYTKKSNGVIIDIDAVSSSSSSDFGAMGGASTDAACMDFIIYIKNAICAFFLINVYSLFKDNLCLLDNEMFDKKLALSADLEEDLNDVEKQVIKREKK